MRPSLFSAPRTACAPLAVRTRRKHTCSEPYATFIQEAAGLAPPPRLESLVRCLQQLGEQVRCARRPRARGAVVLCHQALTHRSRGQLVPPSERAGLHPLVIPLSRNPRTGGLTGLLRWPKPDVGAGPKMTLPVVTTKPGAKNLVLLAPTAELFVLRQAATRDALGDQEAHAFLDVARLEPPPLYEAGAVGAARIGLQRWLLAKAGPFPDLYEQFARMHLERGDADAALVTADRACAVFGGWGRSLWFASRLYARLGRAQEAREGARLAMECPLWTLDCSPYEVARAAGYQDLAVKNLQTMLRALNESEKASQSLAPEEKALYRGQIVMDHVCVRDDIGWDDIISELAQAYAEGDAELRGVARFVEASR